MLLLWGAVAWGQPSANFSANVTSGCVPLLVQFQDQSTGAIVTRNWTLGPSSSSVANPVQLYNAGGTYTICLTVTDTAGLSDTHCKTNYISAFALPTVDFVASPTVGCLPANVAFTDNSSSPSGAAITQWAWSFGDGGSSTQPNPSHTYTQVNTFDVNLRVTDANGCVRSLNKVDYVDVVAPPQAGFTATNRLSCSVPHAVTFNNTTVTGGNYSYLWEFGDGTTSTVFSPVHTYQTSGIYTVRLTVTDNATGCTDVFTRNNYVDLTPKLSFAVSDTTGCGPTTFQFTNTTPGNSSGWVWHFGTGDSATVENPSYTYTTPGNYSVSLTATDATGCRSTKVDTFLITIYPEPTVSYTSTGALQSCSFPHAVSFQSNASLPVDYLWDFGDGTTDTVANPTHIFTGNGTFPVRLTVTTADGCTASVLTDTVTIQPTVANFSADQLSGCAPLAVNLTDLSTSLFPVTNWDWTINGVSYTQQNPSLLLTDTGYVDLQLIVTDASGCMDTIVSNSLIAVGTTANLSFSVTNAAPCVGDSTRFINTSDTYIQEWNWDFGDGGSSQAFEPIYYYQDTGGYNVTLTGTHYDCISTLSLLNVVSPPSPRARFSTTVVCDSSDLVRFNNTSRGGHRWHWDFGDPTTQADTSLLENPRYTYPARGNYRVILTAYDDSTGCVHADTNVVRIRLVEAAFAVSPDTICAGDLVSLQNNSLGANAYLWSSASGNLTNATDTVPDLTYTQGFYTGIQLIATDVNSCADTALFSGEIAVSDVSPQFAIDTTTGCVPFTVQFTDQSTTFLGALTGWQWNFGDGNGSNAPFGVSHTYQTRGNYSPRLRVTNSYGCTRVLVQNSAVQPTYPYVDFDGDTLACTGQNVSFTEQASGTNVTYFWDFGDGNTSTQANPTHAYASEGLYTVCLTVVDENGCDSTYCQPDFVRIADPLAGFTADTTRGRCGTLTVQFLDTSSNAVTRRWFFGDGTSSLLPNPIKTYTTGSYDVMLVINNGAGCRDTIFKPHFIQVTSPSASIDFTPSSGCPPLGVTFTAITEGIQTLTWVPGDGGQVIQQGTFGNDTLSVTYDYQSGGIYTPVLIAESEPGCQEVVIADSTVAVEVFELDIAVTDTLVCDTGTIDFTALVTTPIPIDTLLWTFSGGSVSTSQDSIVSVFFNSPGTYTATLYAGNGVCDRTFTRTIEVVPSPAASFIYTPTTLCDPTMVSFSSTSTLSSGAITQTLWDFGAYGTDTLLTSSIFVPQADTFGVQLVAVSDRGCTDTTIQTIAIHPTPVADAGQDFQVCRGEVGQLQGSGNGSYSWSPAAPLSCSNCPNPLFTLNQSTTFVLTVTTPEGCVDTDTVRVTLNPFSTPIIQVSNDTVVCEGDVIQLFVSGGTSVIDYTWDTSRPGLSCYVGCSNPFASPTVTTTYPVTLTGPGGCQSHDSIRVTVINDEADIAGPDRVICGGDTAQLSIAFGNNPVWTPYDGLSCAFCPDPIASPSEPTTYSVTVTTDNGCTVSDTIRLTPVPTDAIDAGPDLTICTGGSIALQGSANPAVASLVRWNNGATLSDSLSLTAIATPTQTTTYSLSANAAGCTLRDSMTVFVVNSATISDATFELCEDEIATLSLAANAQTFEWTPTVGLSDPTSPNPVIQLSSSQVYTVTASLPTCPSATATITVNVTPSPQIEGFGVQQVFAGTTAPIGLTVEQNAAFTYQWSPNVDISCTNCPQPLIQANTDGLQYTVLVTTPDGCQAQDSITIDLVEGCNGDLIVMPNIFTPNGDGNNDRLFVRGSSIQRLKSFKVFARSGELVFESSDLNIGWDGTYQGQALDTGVFVYYIEAFCELDGRLITKKGNVTLVR